MHIYIQELINPVFGAFASPRHIRRIKDGSRVDRVTEHDLQGLSERTLRDIGFTATPG